jgi:hypothetical protein
MSFEPGASFLLKGESSPNGHLYIILAVDASTNSIVAVPLNTKTTYTDPTLTLRVGDHPFVNRETSVSYDRMREFRIAELYALSVIKADIQYFSWHADCDPRLLETLTYNAYISNRSTPKMLGILTNMLG